MSPDVHFSASEFRRRYSAIRSLMEKEELAALVVYGNSGNLMRNEANIFYLSDYMDSHQSYIVFPRDGEPVLFVGLYNHLANAKEASVVEDTRWGGENPAKVVAEELRKRKPGRMNVGVWAVGGAKGFIPHDHYLTISKELPNIQLRDITGKFNSLRLVKSSEELRRLARAAKFTDDGIAELARHTRPGMNESELAALVEKGYTDQGGETYLHYISSTSMSNPQRCVPWQRPTNRTIKKGDVILTEISASYGGYSGQVHRPIAVGAEPTGLFQRLYSTAREAYHGVANQMKAGTRAEAAVEGASVIGRRGFTICDSLAHGFGVDLLPPHLGIEGSPYWPPSPLELREGMAVVIQPNPVTIDQTAGVQLGNLCVIERNGARSIQRYPMEFAVT